MGIECCAKCVLIFFNIWFAIVGFLLLAVGAFIKIGWSVIYGFVGPILEGLVPSQIGGLVSQGVNATTKATSLLDSLGITPIIEGASTTLIIIGVFLFVIGCLACCGACCKVKPMLIIYAIVVGIIFLAELVCVILFVSMKSETQALLKEGLNKTIQTQYGGLTSFDGPSLGFNFVMVQYKCCGIDNYTEFYSAQKWQQNITKTISGVNITIIQQTPMACCKVNGTFPTVTPIDTNCTIAPTSLNSNFQTGCYNVVEKEIETYIAYVAGALAGIAVIEIVMFAFAIVLVVKNNKVDPAG